MVPGNALLVLRTMAVIGFPEHIVWLDGVAVVTGLGCTVTSTVNADPLQPFALGVIV